MLFIQINKYIYIRVYFYIVIIKKIYIFIFWSFTKCINNIIINVKKMKIICYKETISKCILHYTF